MSEVSALENQLSDAKQIIARRDLALKLYNNPDFKSLILDQFCTQECSRYAQLSADPSLNENQRQDALAMAQAAGHLRRYLSITVQMGNAAANQIGELDEMIVAARQEEDE